MAVLKSCMGTVNMSLSGKVMSVTELEVLPMTVMKVPLNVPCSTA